MQLLKFTLKKLSRINQKNKNTKKPLQSKSKVQLYEKKFISSKPIEFFTFTTFRFIPISQFDFNLFQSPMCAY